MKTKINTVELISDRHKVETISNRHKVEPISDWRFIYNGNRRLPLLVLLILLIWSISLSAELITINSKEKNAVTINILDDQADYTIVEFLLNYYIKDTIEINKVEYTTLDLPYEGKRYEVSNPDLPLSTRSVAIPYQGKMYVEWQR